MINRVDSPRFWLIPLLALFIPIQQSGTRAARDPCAKLAAELEPTVKARLKSDFQQAGLAYPLKQMTIIALKEEKRLEIWGIEGGRRIFLRAYPILAASGRAGPKLKEGDCQVPEGVYRIVGINPRSRYHISMALDYPNAFDREMARRDGRTNLGDNICIHGKACSIGCIAIGDPPIEDLFVLVYRAGLRNAKVIIAPNDLRLAPPVDQGQMRLPWIQELYGQLRVELAAYRR